MIIYGLFNVNYIPKFMTLIKRPKIQKCKIYFPPTFTFEIRISNWLTLACLCPFILLLCLAMICDINSSNYSKIKKNSITKMWVKNTSFFNLCNPSMHNQAFLFTCCFIKKKNLHYI